MEKERNVLDMAVEEQNGRQRIFTKFSLINISSEKFTYKIDDSKENKLKQQGHGKKTTVPSVNILVHNEAFLKKLKAILEYSE